jgi:hypothetical protein
VDDPVNLVDEPCSDLGVGKQHLVGHVADDHVGAGSLLGREIATDRSQKLSEAAFRRCAIARTKQAVHLDVWVSAQKITEDVTTEKSGRPREEHTHRGAVGVGVSTSAV